MKQKRISSPVADQYFEQVAACWPALKGSLTEVRKPCIRPNCKACASGQKHPNHLLAFTHKGKRRCMYVPLPMVPVLQQALENGRKLEQLLYDMGPALLREYRALNPTQTGPAVNAKGKKPAKPRPKS